MRTLPPFLRRCGTLGFGLLLVTGCMDLDRANLTEPDPVPALTDPDSLVATAHGGLNGWWRATTHYKLSMLLETGADALTTNTCRGLDANHEPRQAYNNALSASLCTSGWTAWQQLYGAYTDAASAIFAIDYGVLPTDDARREPALAAALFTSAASLSSLAFVFDSAFVLPRDGSASGAETLRPYAVVRDSALQLYDELIALTEGKTWQLPAEAFPLSDGALTAERLHRIARTMAARTLVLSARSAAENGATDWGRVLQYADGGLSGTGVTDFDFGAVDDGGLAWYDYVKLYGALESWMRVDQRVIHRMAPNVPATFNGLANQPEPEPTDARLALANLPCETTNAGALECAEGITADYVYLGNVVGDPGRGIWMQSPFWHRRYVQASFMVASSENVGQPLPHVLAAENDLMIAESLVRTGGDLTRAATLVNKTRVGRGQLPSVAPEATALLAAIEYERDVELLNTGGISLFDRRRVDGLAPGQYRHLPVPADVLQPMGKPIYTYGGSFPDM